MNIKKRVIPVVLATSILFNSITYAATPFSKLWDKINDQVFWDKVRDSEAAQDWAHDMDMIGVAAPIVLLGSWYGLFRPLTRSWLKADAQAQKVAVANLTLLPKYLKIVYKMEVRMAVWEHLGLVWVDPKYRKAAEMTQQLREILQDPQLAEKIAKVVLK